MKAVTKTDNNPNRPSHDRNGVFSGMLRVVVVALAIGVVLTVFLASRTNENGAEQTASNSIEEQIENGYGEKWRGLGITDWVYNPQASTVFYVESEKWQKLGDDRQEAVLRGLWRDIKDIETTNEQDRDQVFVMIHDEKRRMRAVYEAESGFISY